MNDETTALHIEGLLFGLGRPLSRAELAKAVGVGQAEIEAGIRVLLARPQNAGLVLVDDGKVVELRTAPQVAELIEKVRKEEYARDIGKAGLEALAAVIYRGPLTRSEIDFIRGVNSSQTLRTLLMRGLVRRVPNPKDERSFLYEATTELLSQLGAQHQSDLPQYAEVKEKLGALEAAYRAAETRDSQSDTA